MPPPLLRSIPHEHSYVTPVRDATLNRHRSLTNPLRQIIACDADRLQEALILVALIARAKTLTIPLHQTRLMSWLNLSLDLRLELVARNLKVIIL